MFTRKRLTASTLRENVSQVLDQALETGTPVGIERRGTRFRVVPTEGAVSRIQRRLKRLKARRYL